MWLSGKSRPDFRTINRFRGEYPKEHIKELFTGIILMLNELGYLSLDVQYIDVAKIKAASNGYTFIKHGSVEKNKSKPEDKIRSILSDIDTHIEQEKQDRRSGELPVIDSQGLNTNEKHGKD